MDHSHKRFNPEQVNKLMSQERYQLLQPEKLIDHLEVKESDIVADLGSGAGFFTIPLAKQTEKVVYAIDIEPKMIELLREAASNQLITNINGIVSNLNQIPLEDRLVDKLMAAFVLHEVDHLQTTIREIARVTKSGGKVMFIEFEAKETESGPPVEIRISSSVMKQILKDNQFKNICIYSINSSHYMLIAERK
ncbi:Ubiquinone/menaquinone biosynthesis C-methyltransferase UbiE [Paraliobacillus sp. PM-2]|uniref:class I SAM-dependent methyltransferase n=1 Tax=Paraliobacillus sp. PM-2 TaxID=1462524 RepID=UPI00061C30C5|nr:methyltransferase domain-containing protein [Paraliobacillus sp. PM-2]CQR47920.1 Ubiquinone/menaquinone biosynthesis C-methyltransferase UbiE [Paraliobacillus sp. PM-2]